MSIRAKLRSWLRATLGRDTLERRMQQEMQTHLELHEADLRRSGLSATEAHRQARADFGSLEAHKDECREALGLRLLDELRGDVVYALRLLRRSPWFALVALLSLALGIGANTAIFSLVDMVLMKNLPVRDPASLVFVDTSAGKSGGSNGPPYPLFEALIVLQITMAVALMCGAALFLRTLQSLGGIDAGFVRQGLLTMNVEASMPRYEATATPDERRATHARIGALWTDLAGRVAAMPGVTSAAVGTLSPLTGRDRGVRVAVAGMTLPEPLQSVHLNQVSAGYFDTLGVFVVSGRLFTPQDRASSPRVAILNQTAARSYFGDASPIGRSINFPGQRVQDPYEIVGVVRDVRYASLRREDQRMAYLPIEQAIDPIGNLMVHARTDTSVAVLAPLVRAAARDAVPNGFVARIGAIEQRIESSLLAERLLSILATFFGALALALACIGLYGVTAFAVIRRTREIGIRIAVGADHGSVVWMMLRETLVLVAAGVVIGTLASLGAGRYVSAQLFGVTPGDPIATGAAVAVLLIVTFAAAYVPARRASRIAPTVALRYE